MTCSNVPSISSKQNSQICQIIFKISRKIISTYFQFETIIDATAEKSSCSKHGETKNTSMYSM